MHLLKLAENEYLFGQRLGVAAVDEVWAAYRAGRSVLPAFGTRPRPVDRATWLAWYAKEVGVCVGQLRAYRRFAERVDPLELASHPHLTADHWTRLIKVKSPAERRRLANRVFAENLSPQALGALVMKELANGQKKKL